MILGKLDDENKQNESRYVFTILNKISFKWIKVLNLKPEMLKELEENISSTLQDICVGNDIQNKFICLGMKAKN